MDRKELENVAGHCSFELAVDIMTDSYCACHNDTFMLLSAIEGCSQELLSSYEKRMRNLMVEVIVEAFVNFHSEITLLTVTQNNNPTLFCAPIGHRQERGDYQESWQPARVSDRDLAEAQDMARKVTEALGGAGLFGVEFFLTDEGVYFSELSPRPHDTGMVTLAGTQNFNEFELHLRAVLSLPIFEITQEKAGASAVLLASAHSENPTYTGIATVAGLPKTDFRIFGKPTSRPYRRMGVVLTHDVLATPIEQLVERAQETGQMITVNP